MWHYKPAACQHEGSGTAVWSLCYESRLSFWKLKEKSGVRKLLRVGRQAALTGFDCGRFAGCFHGSLMLLCNFQPPAGCSALLQPEMAVAPGFRTNSS